MSVAEQGILNAVVVLDCINELIWDSAEENVLKLSPVALNLCGDSRASQLEVIETTRVLLQGKKRKLIERLCWSSILEKWYFTDLNKVIMTIR